MNSEKPEVQTSSDTDAAGDTLPEWCQVYAGLSDEEIADLERAVLSRADFNRPVD